MIAVLGAGAWGSSLAAIASANGYDVNTWSRQGTLSLTDAVTGAEIVVSAISMQGVREVIGQLQGLTLSPQTVIISATKGLDPQTTCTPCQIWQDAFPYNPIVVLSGPNLSKEIEKGLPAATVVASNIASAASKAQLIFSSHRFRVYTNSDPLGVELGGTLKNVIAIAAGVCDGLQLGTNAKAALVARGLTEMVRMAVHWGAKQETFYGLSGLGDLLATCNSPLSRNYQVGYHLAGGKDITEILANLRGTAEGINTTMVLQQRSQQQNISMPITEQVYCLLQGQITPKQALEELMLRDMKSEYQQ
ncbi:MAG: NAD(P)H-dependent glycerol-3-phosphate dehydrogenase [Richelia sp.]|nr:NAD(P)H-dependent glycerol-3-phosphate dehydrogenase [Richelia sp.]CDN15524.1 Glycerol-3-phosphate dehydrogenase [NAD(P)+] [Richelia intracellularis]